MQSVVAVITMYIIILKRNCQIVMIGVPLKDPSSFCRHRSFLSFRAGPQAGSMEGVPSRFRFHLSRRSGTASTGGPCFPSLHKLVSHRPPFGWECRFVGFSHGGQPAPFVGSLPPECCRRLCVRSPRSSRTSRGFRGTENPRVDVKPQRGKTPPRHTDLSLKRERGPGPGFRGGDGRGDAALWSGDGREIPRGGGGDCVDDRYSGVAPCRVGHHGRFPLASRSLHWKAALSHTINSKSSEGRGSV